MRVIGFIWFAAALLAPVFSCKTSKSLSSPAMLLNQEAVSTHGDAMLLGRIDRNRLAKAPFGSWFNAEYEAYVVHTTALASVQGQLKDVDIEVFMGTWCSDSQREVPRFFKILDHLKTGEQRLAIFALDDHPDRRKTSPQGEEKGKNIELVPTFIFLRGGKELGRIVESPQVSLEADMAAILAK